jgi:cold shock protein
MRLSIRSAVAVPAAVACVAFAGCGDATRSGTATSPAPAKPAAVGGAPAQHELRPASSSELGRYGKVTFWNPAKGFGSIEEQDSHREAFVHVTGLQPPLKDLESGQRVRFRTRAGRKGLEAYDVTVVKVFLAASGRRGG